MDLAAGLRKHGKGLVFEIAGESYSSADVLRLVQGRIERANRTAAAKAAFHAAVIAEREEVRRTEPLLEAVRRTLVIRLGELRAQGEFGIEPPKARRALTTKQREAALEKARATRRGRREK